jgi:hypothetical protein
MPALDKRGLPTKAMASAQERLGATSMIAKSRTLTRPAGRPVHQTTRRVLLIRACAYG